MSATTGFTSKLKMPGNKINPDIVSFNIAAANTEQTVTFPSGTVYFSVQNTGKTTLRMAYSATETDDNGDYICIFPGTSREVDGIGAVNLSIYLRAPAIQRVEIESWSQ